MKLETFIFIWGLSIGAVSTFVLLMMLFGEQIQDLKHEAVKTECARYNPQTAEFEWILKESK